MALELVVVVFYKKKYFSLKPAFAARLVRLARVVRQALRGAGDERTRPLFGNAGPG